MILWIDIRDEFIHPEYSLLSAGCRKVIDEALTDTIKLVLHVDDSFVHIFEVLIALYRFPAVCIHVETTKSNGRAR